MLLVNLNTMTSELYSRFAIMQLCMCINQSACGDAQGMTLASQQHELFAEAYIMCNVSTSGHDCPEVEHAASSFC